MNNDSKKDRDIHKSSGESRRKLAEEALPESD